MMVDVISMNLSEREPGPGEHVEDGLICCDACGMPREAIVHNPFNGKRQKVRCICKCQQERDRLERDAADLKARRERASRLIGGRRLASFSEDDGRDQASLRRARNYAERFEDFRGDGIGLLMYGPTGTGKTRHGECIADLLVSKGMTVMMASVPQLVSDIQRSTYAKEDPLREAVTCDLLILDDLGAERGTEYAREQVYSVIDGRYSRAAPIVASTNLTPGEMAGAQDLTLRRIYGRILERCIPLEYKVERRRSKGIDRRFADILDGR